MSLCTSDFLRTVQNEVKTTPIPGTEVISIYLFKLFYQRIYLNIITIELWLSSKKGAQITKNNLTDIIVSTPYINRLVKTQRDQISRLMTNPCSLLRYFFI